MRIIVRALCMGVALCLAPNVQAASQPDLKALQQELDQLKQNYETRIKTLENRIGELEREQKQAAAKPAPLPAPVQHASAGTNRFNPNVALILTGTAAGFSLSPSTYTVPGFALDSEAKPGTEGLSIGESELVLSANVDDKFYGRLTTSLTPENTLSIEEALIQTLDLPNGFTLQAGRFYSDIGYLNSKHTHTWDFVDAPLAYRAMLGNQYGDDGVQLRWLAPTDQFLEFGAEVFRGDGFPAGGGAHHGFGSRTLFVHTGADVGDSNSWLAGLSLLDADAVNRDAPTGYAFTGSSRVAIANLVWKWAPNGNPYTHNLTLQGEYLHRSEKGSYNFSSLNHPYDASQSGWYAQAVYQFMPRWRVGVRYDRLHADNPGAAYTGTPLDPAGHTPQRTSLMLDFANSEFSRLRLQFNHDQSGPSADNQWFLQYIMALGAHGAHRY